MKLSDIVIGRLEIESTNDGEARKAAKLPFVAQYPEISLVGDAYVIKFRDDFSVEFHGNNCVEELVTFNIDGRTIDIDIAKNHAFIEGRKIEY